MISVERIRGAVFLRLPDEKTFVPLKRQRLVPEGTEIDASNGQVRLTKQARTTGTFYEGRFVIAFPSQPRGVVELRLSGGSFKPCAPTRTVSARATAQKPPRRSVRRLWGNAKGKFRTKGRYSYTTVRGTAWLTDDRCDGTLTRVKQGRILTFDTIENRSIALRAGQSHLAEAPIEFTVPTERASPASIVAGPDGNMWFTERTAANLGRSTPTGNIIELALPPGPGEEEPTPTPSVIVVGPDRNLWFTDTNSPSVGRITPAGDITQFAVGADSQGITAGPDGALWFTQASEAIGRITPDGTVVEFPVPLDVPGDAQRITLGPDGNLWFTEFYGNRIGRITPQGVVTEFPLPTEDAFPFGITRGPDGAVWFTESGLDRIGRISPTGAIREFPIPTEGSEPMEIAVGPDGNLWFTEHLAGNIGRITPTGVVTEIPLPTPSGSPMGIASGPKKTVWFTDESSNTIGCIRC
jgi:streptogramin lyase